MNVTRTMVVFMPIIFVAVQVAGIFAIVYFAARLAIRHERRAQHDR